MAQKKVEIEFINNFKELVYEKSYLTAKFMLLSQSVSRLKKINLPGFREVWLRDESVNPTGTHKDYLAFHLIQSYFMTINKSGQINKKNDGEKTKYIDKPLSLLTSGSAGFAIQYLFRQIPEIAPLKCLVDDNTEEYVVKALKALGAEVFTIDLSKKCFNSEEILTLTENFGGTDITSCKSCSPRFSCFDLKKAYFELACNLQSIVKQTRAEMCFIPYGSGHLFEEIEHFGPHNDLYYSPRFIGATTINPSSKATKLYAPFRPFRNRRFKIDPSPDFLLAEENTPAIMTFREEFLEQAIEIAQKQNIVAEESALGGLALLLQLSEVKEIGQEIRNKIHLVLSTGRTKYEIADMR